MCRDIAEAQKGRSVMSVVCCGHSPKSRIEHMAFKPDGSFLVRPLCMFIARFLSLEVPTSVKCVSCMQENCPGFWFSGQGAWSS